MPLMPQVAQVAKSGTVSCNRLKLDLHLQIIIFIEMKILVFQNVPNIQYVAVIYASCVI